MFNIKYRNRRLF
jgi:hypothetical protein